MARCADCPLCLAPRGHHEAGCPADERPPAPAAEAPRRLVDFWIHGTGAPRGGYRPPEEAPLP